MRNGDPKKAAFFYDAEINATSRIDQPIDPKLFLNAGLAHLEAGSLQEANQFLESSLDASLTTPIYNQLVLMPWVIYFIEKQTFGLISRMSEKLEKPGRKP